MPRKPPIARDTGAVPYGQGQRLADAQREIPVVGPGTSVVPARPAAPPAGPATGGGMADAIAAAASMAPPSGGGLGKPTDRPAEPVTAGLDIGAGPGIGKIGMPLVPEEDDALRQLLLAYQATGSEAIARIIEVIRTRAAARAQGLGAARNVPAAVGPRRPL